MTGIIDEIEHDVEELFPPKPGGMVDRWRKSKAEAEAKAKDAEHAAELIEQPSFKAVKVAQEMPEVVSPITYTIAPGASAMILSASPYRFRATLNLTFASGASVILAKDSGAALAGNGYWLQNGNPPLVVSSRAQLWAYNPTATVDQVSVLAELYAPEQ